MKKKVIGLVLVVVALIGFLATITTSKFTVIDVYEDTVVMSYNGGETVFEKTSSDSVEVGDTLWGWSILGSSPDPWGYEGKNSSPQ